jgi:hypothetical protein
MINARDGSVMRGALGDSEQSRRRRGFTTFVEKRPPSWLACDLTDGERL